MKLSILRLNNYVIFKINSKFNEDLMNLLVLLH